MVPVLMAVGLGLSLATLLSGCEASSSPDRSNPPNFSDPNRLPLVPDSVRSRGVYRQILQGGIPSERLDRGYYVSRFTGSFQTTGQAMVTGERDGTLHSVEVYLGAIDLAEANPEELHYEGILQSIYADRHTRLDFALALTHSPHHREQRLSTAENIMGELTQNYTNQPYFWLILADIQQMQNNEQEAEASYRSALHLQEGSRSYATLMRLVNLLERQGRHREAEVLQNRAWELESSQD